MTLFAATGDSVARLDADAEGLRVSLSLRASGAQCIAAGDGALYAGSRGTLGARRPGFQPLPEKKTTGCGASAALFILVGAGLVVIVQRLLA